MAAPGLGHPHAATAGGVDFLAWRREKGGGREHDDFMVKGPTLGVLLKEKLK